MQKTQPNRYSGVVILPCRQQQEQHHFIYVTSVVPYLVIMRN